MDGMVRRNEKCFCGSGRRFKHCHGALSVHTHNNPIENWHTTPQRVRDAFNQKQAARVRHFEELGFHRPPLIAGADGDRLIVRGKELLHWKGRGSFLNFLASDLHMRMGEPFRSAMDHPLNIWWKAIRAQAQSRRHFDESRGLASTVAVLNFFTVAHDLFVLSDNANLRDRLLKSLRVVQEFHGARYELMIAACLIRSGFTVVFSDENDFTKKHSDAIAHHLRTGRRYFIEMKTKGRAGILGKPGEKPSPETMKRDVSRLMRDALDKPADGERLIFIDMNLPLPSSPWRETGVWWQNDAVASIRAVEEQPGNLPAGVSAFVIFTNSPAHHLPLDEYYVGLETAFTGFNRPRFAKDIPLNEAFPDIADLFRAFGSHDMVPDEFGSDTVFQASKA